MRPFRFTCLAPAFLYTTVAWAQSGYLSPDGKARYPGVTVFCPNGTGVTPCSFGGGGANANVTVNLGGNAVGRTNPFPVSDALLDGLITGGALTVGGSISVSGTATVAISGVPSVNLAGGLPAGTNGIGSVVISNFPASQPVSGSVSISGTPAVSLAGALPSGSNALGTVSLAAASVGSISPAGTNGTVAEAVQGISGGIPQSVTGALSQAGTWNVGVSSLPALAAGSNPIGSVTVSNFPASQPVSGAFWQATQPVSVTSLPLPAGAALDSDIIAPYAPVAPAAATATKTLMIGCLAYTTLPSFTAGQEGAVPCDSSGRPYVVTVPSANNVPAYLQAVSSGGATPGSAANAAASCMATNLKTSSGMVFSYSVSNTNSSGVWFRMFASAAAPTCGSGTPAKRIYVPAGSTIGLSSDVGWVFSTGIGYDVTAGSGADSDSTTVAAANTVLVNIDFK